MQVAERIQVANLILQETGTYNQQFARPYEVINSYDNLEGLAMRVQEASRTNYNAHVQNSFVSGLASGIVIPSAAPSFAIEMPHGWGSRRLRFLMEVHISRAFNTEVYYFQGYTDHCGVTPQGSIDQNMIFYINSYIRINRTTDYNNPIAGVRDTIRETAQVINGQMYVTSANTNEVFVMRPTDLFVGINSEMVSNTISTGLGGLAAVDTRINRSTETVSSNRSNAIPSNFVATVLNGYRNALSAPDHLGNGGDIFSRSSQLAKENFAYENPFLRALTMINGQRSITWFTMRDLYDLDSDSPSRTTYLPAKDVYQLHSTGQSEGWNGSNYETMTASIVSNAVSALMFECMIVSISFSSTNMTFSGMPDTRIINARGISNVGMEQNFARFVQRFETEVMPDITHNGEIGISLMVVSDISGDTSIQVGIENNPIVPYVAPAFCDSLLSPVVTRSADVYNNNVNGMHMLINTLDQHAAPTPFIAADHMNSYQY